MKAELCFHFFRITDEIEALEAILLDDVTIHCDGGRPYMVETVVHPSTGDDTDLQYVCVTLEVTLTPEYPDTSPSVKLRSPRGLDDSIVESIMKQIHLKLLECIGQSVVFELIEVTIIFFHKFRLNYVIIIKETYFSKISDKNKPFFPYNFMSTQITLSTKITTFT